ncbi:MAG: PorT family protein [Cyclobacteriaceae bacterium]|nr:PorT family protein [Cyclobacteriaceae bacterium]
MKTTTLTIVFAWVVLDAFSQINIELHGGLTSSIFKVKEIQPGSVAPSFVRRYGYHLGATAGFPVSEISIIETGLFFSSRGTTVENNSFWGFNITLSDLKLNYLEIPLLFSVGHGSFRVFAGPQYSILVAAKSEEHDVKDLFDNGSLELRYGFGFQGKAIGARLSFINGFTAIQVSDYFKWRNNAYTFSVTYALAKSTKTPKSKTSSDIPHRTLD